MTDKELVDEFIVFEPVNGRTDVMVKSIYWAGPHTPHSKWIKVATLPVLFTEADRKRTVEEILNMDRYFSVCIECDERKSNGWMHGDDICQSCAESNHGVIH